MGPAFRHAKTAGTVLRSAGTLVGVLALLATAGVPVGAQDEPAISPAPVTCGDPGTWEPPQPMVGCAEAIIAASRVLPSDALTPRAVAFEYGMPCPDGVPCPMPFPTHGFVLFHHVSGPDLVVRVTLDPDTGVVTAKPPEPWPAGSPIPRAALPGIADPLVVGFDGHSFSNLPVSLPAGSRITILATGTDGVIVELARRNDGITTPWPEILASPESQQGALTLPVQPIFAAAGQRAERALPFDTRGSYLLGGYTVPRQDANGDRAYPSIGCTEVTVTGPGTSPGPIQTRSPTMTPLCVPSPISPPMTPSPGP